MHLPSKDLDALSERVREVLRRAELAAMDNTGRTPIENRLALSSNATARFNSLRSSVQTAILQLKAVLEAAEAKHRERQWLKNQLSGDIDDQRLVDGITGDGRIYRRRGTPDKKHGLLQVKPKRMLFLLDCSASMARMNAADGRLDRMAACAILIMEALQGFEYKFDYSVIGHSGSTAQFPLVAFGAAPKSKEEKAAVVDKMYMHARGASSGDRSIEAAVKASFDVSNNKADADDYLVFLFSDANLGRYGISPASIAAALKGDGRSQVKTKLNTYEYDYEYEYLYIYLYKNISVITTQHQGYCILVAEPDAASWLMEELPLGRGYVAMDPQKLPQTFKEIFSHSALEQ